MRPKNIRDMTEEEEKSANIGWFKRATPARHSMKAGLTAVFMMFFAAILSGCALMTVGTSVPVSTYDLIAPSHISPRGKRLNHQLLVNDPITVRAFDTDKIVVRLHSGQITYFPQAVWTDRLPRLLQMRLVESLDNARVARAVGSRSERMSSAFSLSTQIRAFQLDANKGKAAAHIHLFMKLLDERAGLVVAARGFKVIVPAANDDPESGVAALNQAFALIIRKVARWIARTRLTPA